MNILVSLLVGLFPLIIFGAIGFAIILAFSKKSSGGLPPIQPRKNHVVVWPYEAKKAALSPAEISFYNALKQTLPSYAVVATKMNLKDCIFVKGQAGSNFQYYYKRLVYHNVDFMLLDNNTFKPICGILLHDSGIKDAKKSEQVNDMKTLFSNAEMPLFVIEPKSSYSITDLNALFGGYYQNTVKDEEIVTDQKDILCPKCGADMVIRTAKSGENEGKSFYGCSKYPGCKGIVNLY